MNEPQSDLATSRRHFFRFVIKRGILGTCLSFCVSGTLIASNVANLRDILFRADDIWLWTMIFVFDVWVTVTGMTLAISFWFLGRGNKQIGP